MKRSNNWSHLFPMFFLHRFPSSSNYVESPIFVWQKMRHHVNDIINQSNVSWSIFTKSFKFVLWLKVEQLVNTIDFLYVKLGIKISIEIKFCATAEPLDFEFWEAEMFLDKTCGQGWNLKEKSQVVLQSGNIKAFIQCCQFLHFQHKHHPSRRKYL